MVCYASIIQYVTFEKAKTKNKTKILFESSPQFNNQMPCDIIVFLQTSSQYLLASLQLFRKKKIMIQINTIQIQILSTNFKKALGSIFVIQYTVKSLLVPRVLFFLSTFNGHFYLVKFGYNSRFGYYTRAGTNRSFTVLTYTTMIDIQCGKFTGHGKLKNCQMN